MLLLIYKCHGWKVSSFKATANLSDYVWTNGIKLFVLSLGYEEV